MTQLTQSLSEPFKKFVLRLFLRGTSAFIIIFGRRETGKTDLSLLIAEILHADSSFKFFATNIKIYDSPFHIEHITNLDDLKFWSEQNKGKKLFIFDEYGKAMRRRSPMSSLNVKLIDELQVLRKNKQSTIAVTVNEKYIDNASLGSDVLDGYFFKPNYKNPKIAYYTDLLEYQSQTLRNIPRTSIKFDTWDVAIFKEHGIKQKPRFKSEELATAWDYAHGASGKDLDLHPQQVHRIITKVLKYYMEKEQSQLTSK